MGNQQPGGGPGGLGNMGGPGGPGRPGQTAEQREAERKRRQEEQKRKQEAGPQRIGRKKKRKLADNSQKLPVGKYIFQKNYFWLIELTNFFIVPVYSCSKHEMSLEIA